MVRNGVLFVVVLEVIGCSFVPFPLYASPPTALLRLAKPAALVGLAHALSVLAGDSVGLAAVVAIAAAGAAAHAAHRGGTVRGWLAATSPYLFRNGGQTRAWAVLAG